MKKFAVRYTKCPTDFNRQHSAVVEANNPEDARELLSRYLGEDRASVSRYVIQKAFEYNPKPIEGKIVTMNG